MNKLTKWIYAVWMSIPPKLQGWIKGLEVAILTGAVSAAFAYPVSDFSTKEGIAKFIAVVVAAAGGAMRLYIIQSPFPLSVKTVAIDNMTFKTNVAVNADQNEGVELPQPTLVTVTDAEQPKK